MKNPASATMGLLRSEKRYPCIDVLYHVAHYHSARVGYQDVISRSLHGFKDGAEPQTTRWIRLAVPPAAAELKSDLIIRALGSNEEVASDGTPLDRLCAEIAAASGATYAPERLKKTRMIRPLASLAGRALRQRELDGVYEFSAEGLAPDARVLIVDDLATTGSTMGAIATAVRAALPGGSVSCFVLARVAAQLHNAHLNVGYFLNGEDAVLPEIPQLEMETQKAPPAVLARAQVCDPPLSRPPASTRRSSVPKIAPPVRRAQGPGSNRRSVMPAVPPKRRGLDTRVYVIGLMLSLVVLGVTVMLPAKKDPVVPAPQFTRLVAENAVRSPEPLPARREIPAPVQVGTPGVVTVPGTGLRANHSMDSRVLPKAGVRLKERVEILRRFSPQIGPDWVQVRTRSGAVGWVVASVVKEVRG